MANRKSRDDWRESGQRVDAIDVESFCKRARMSNDGPFKIIRTREEVDNIFCHSCCFDNVTKVVNWISRTQKTLTRFQFITKQLMTEKKISCDSVILESVETKFTSRHSMMERVIHHNKVFKHLVKLTDEHFLDSGFGNSPSHFCE